MKKHLFFLGLLCLPLAAAHATPLIAVVSQSQKVLQDPKTRVIYYLESDLRHIAALSPDGKLLWCCEVIPATANQTHNRAMTKLLSGHRWQIIGFSDDAEDDFIRVTTNPAGPEYGVINKETGIYTSQGAD